LFWAILILILIVVCILGRFQMTRMMMKDFPIPVLEVRMTSQTLIVLSNAC